MGNIGAFGGMFDLSKLAVKEPVLVSGTDGVGTKLKLAFEMDKHDTIGIDAVAMCVNDVLAQGAEPLFFLDYVAVGHNDPAKIEAIVAGVAEGCRQAGCALIGGETAEMPGMYGGGVRHRGLHVRRCRAFEAHRRLESGRGRCSGRHIVERRALQRIQPRAQDSRRQRARPALAVRGLGDRPLGEVLLTPTRIYVKPVLQLLAECDVHGISHITGGGFDENIPRILRPGQGIEIREGSWEILPVFRMLEHRGSIAHREMFNIFNMGIGMVVALDPSQAEHAVAVLGRCGERAQIIGRVTDREGVEII